LKAELKKVFKSKGQPSDNRGKNRANSADDSKRVIK
jgi:hypothetical protein